MHGTSPSVRLMHGLKELLCRDRLCSSGVGVLAARVSASRPAKQSAQEGHHAVTSRHAEALGGAAGEAAVLHHGVDGAGDCHLREAHIHQT